VADGVKRTLEYGLTVDYLGDPVGLNLIGVPLYLGGCALATTRTVFTKLGGFDASFFMFCEDLDFCWRALLHGCDVTVVDAARVSHRGGGSTSGGYVIDGRIHITAFRIALRERNTLATLIKCGPATWVALMLPLRLVRIGVITIIALACRRPDLARGLVGAVTWNVSRLPELMRQRRAIPASVALRRNVLRGRVVRSVNSLRVLLRHGWPRFVDAGTT
jgi:GT2 family glycosyltransferase